MQIILKRKMSFDFGEYTIMVNGKKVEVLLSNEKEKTIELPITVPTEVFLRFNMLQTSNKITVKPIGKSTINVRRNIPINLLGYLSILLFLSTLGDYILADSLWRWPMILFFGITGVILGSWKKLEIV